MSEESSIEFPGLTPLEPYPQFDDPIREDGAGGQYGQGPFDQLGNGEDPVYYRRPFQPYHPISADPSTFVAEGVFIDNHVLNETGDSSTSGREAGTVRVHVPTIGIGGDRIIDIGRPNWTRPRLTLAGINSYNYIRYATDDHGNLKCPDGQDCSGDSSADDESLVWIESHTEEQESTNHKPPDENGNGVDGDYYILIFRTVDNGSGGIRYIHEGHQSNFHWQWHPTVQNLSGLGSEVYRYFDNDLDYVYFRNIFGDYGLLDSKDSTDVVLDFDGANLGTETDLHPVYLEPGDGNKVDADVAEFRQIGPRETSPQVRVIDENGGLRIQGNGNDGTLTWEDCEGDETPLLTWEDGLITVAGDFRIIAGCDNSSSGSP